MKSFKVKTKVVGAVLFWTLSTHSGWCDDRPAVSLSVPLTITNGDHDLLLKLEPNGTLLVDWDKMEDACQSRAVWDTTTAVFCVLWAEHKGNVRELHPSPP